MYRYKMCDVYQKKFEASEILSGMKAPVNEAAMSKYRAAVVDTLASIHFNRSSDLTCAT